MKKKGNILLRAICACLILSTSLLCASAAGENGGLQNFENNSKPAVTFSDVSPRDWFSDSVGVVSCKGLMVGNSATTFNPYGQVTLAETVTIAARLHSIYYTGQENFRQTGVWYQVYLDYAKKVGITCFNVPDYNRQATRAEFAQILASALPAEALAEINALSDNDVPDVSMQMSCAEAVYTLYRAGILTGNDAEGTFAPFSNIKRSEVAAIISRMVDPDARVLLNEPEEEAPDDTERAPENEPDGDKEEPGQDKQETPEEPALTEPTFCVRTVSATAGQEQVAVTISVKNNPGISALALNLSYDSGLVLDSIVYNEQLSGETMLPQTMKNPVKLIWINPFEDVARDFVLATAYFNVPRTAREGEHQISVTYNADDVYALSEENVHFEITPGSVRVIK